MPSDSLASIGSPAPQVYRMPVKTTNGPYACVQAVVEQRAIRGANHTAHMVTNQAAGAFTAVKISSARC